MEKTGERSQVVVDRGDGTRADQVDAQLLNVCRQQRIDQAIVTDGIQADVQRILVAGLGFRRDVHCFEQLVAFTQVAQSPAVLRGVVLAAGVGEVFGLVVVARLQGEQGGAAQVGGVLDVGFCWLYAQAVTMASALVHEGHAQ